MVPDPRRSAAFLLTGLSALLSAGSTLADLGARALRPTGSDDDDAAGGPAPGDFPPRPPRSPGAADAPGPAGPPGRGSDAANGSVAGPAAPPPRPRADPTPPAPRAAATPTPPPPAGGPEAVTPPPSGAGGPAAPPPRSVLDEGDTPVVGDANRARTTASHTEELANQPAATVIRAVRQASTDDLERLYDYEQSHRARKSVLAAIERALAPPPA